MAEDKKRFKAFCAANGLTAKKISEDLGISISTVWAYFQCKRTPNNKIMKALVEKYGIDVYECFLK